MLTVVIGNKHSAKLTHPGRLFIVAPLRKDEKPLQLDQRVATIHLRVYLVSVRRPRMELLCIGLGVV